MAVNAHVKYSYVDSVGYGVFHDEHTRTYFWQLNIDKFPPNLPCDLLFSEDGLYLFKLRNKIGATITFKIRRTMGNDTSFIGDYEA